MLTEKNPVPEIDPNEKEWHWFSAVPFSGCTFIMQEEVYIYATLSDIWHNKDIKSKNLGVLISMGCATKKTEYWAFDSMHISSGTSMCKNELRKLLCDAAQELGANVCKLGEYSGQGCMVTSAEQSAEFFKSEKLT